MATKRLTVKLREEILEEAMIDLFQSKVDAVVEKARKLALKAYQSEYGKDAQILDNLKLEHVNWLPGKTSSVDLCIAKDKSSTKANLWTKETGYIRDNDRMVAGVNHAPLCDLAFSRKSFDLGVNLRFPSYYGSDVTIRLKSHVKEFEKIRDEGITVVKDCNDLRGELSRFLDACKTFKDVETNWPEGVKYLPVSEPPKKLPIPLIDNVRAAMTEGASK